MRFLWLTFVLAVCACAGPLAAHEAHVAKAAIARTPLSLRLVDGKLRVLGTAQVNGTPRTWIIDTGAGSHVVTRGDRGAAIAMLEVRPQTAGYVAADDFTAAGIAGWLSPEELVEQGGAVELDLPRGELLRVDAPAVAQAEAELAARGARIDSIVDAGGLNHPIVHVVLEGHETTMFVDTGSPFTIVFPDSPVGLDVGMRVTSHVAATLHVLEPADYETDSLAIAPATRVRLGHDTVSLERLVLIPRPRGWDEFDGVLGMDALQGCSIMLEGSARGALACTVHGGIDATPALAKATPIAPAPSLARRAPPLPRGTVAQLGCETVSTAELDAFARERDIPAPAARAALLRMRTVAWLARGAGLTVTDGDVDQAAKEHISGSQRARLRDALLEARVSELAGGQVDFRLAQDRLERVAVDRDADRWTERWPAVWPEQIRFEGLAPADERAVRRVFVRELADGRLLTGALERLPTELVDATNHVFLSRGLRAVLVPREDGAVLRIHVTLRDNANPSH